MLQPNGVLSIPELYSAAKIIYLPYDAPAAALAPEFRIIFG
ncbi:hypothetical protein [Nostoc sp. C052]|nr:hypothetical protein [Nostoc sp. C052]